MISHNFIRAGLCALGFAFSALPSAAQTTPAEYTINLYSGAGLGDGSGEIAVFLKYQGAGRSERKFFQKSVAGGSRTKATVEITDVLIRDDTVATSIAGEIVLSDGKALYLPVSVGEFERPDRITFSISPVESKLNAFRASYPFSVYSCASRIDRADLEKVVLASRTILTEWKTYLANEESWNCLNAFFSKNAQTLKQVSPERLNDVMTFLSDFRQFQSSDITENFLELYLQFIRQIIIQDFLNTEMENGVQLKEHLRSELTEIFSKHSDISFLIAGSVFEDLHDRNASEICLQLAPALFNSLTVEQITVLVGNGRGANSPHDALTLSLVTAMDCALKAARDAPGYANGRISGEVRFTAKWLFENHPDFLKSYLGIYDKMEGAGTISTRERLESNTSRATLLYGYYEELFQARPTPRARPEIN